MNLQKQLILIPRGGSEVIYQGKKYGLTKTDFNDGKSTKIYAEELGGNDIISFNFYRTRKGNRIIPCEMTKEKVLNFLANITFV